MKKHCSLISLLLFWCAGAFLATSCSDDDNDGPLKSAHPIESVTALDGSNQVVATISDADKTIQFEEFQNLTDYSSVAVTFKMAKGAILKNPANLTSQLNLTVPFNVVVINGTRTDEETYTLTVKRTVIPDPIISAKVGDQSATIEGSVITIAYAEGMDINAMTFDFELQAGATIKSPADNTFDLEYGEAKMVVTYFEKDFTYTIRQTGYTDPLLSKGWTDETASFGTLPNYIKVYKNTDLLNRSDNPSLGYIAVMGPQSTLGAIGNGNDDKKDITTLENSEPGWNVILVGISASGIQTIVRNGAFVQDPAPIYSFGTLGQDKDGNYKMAWSQKFDDKLYAFPFRSGTAFVQRLQTEGTVWEAQTAVSGIPMILWDGKVLTAEETVCNDGDNIGWYGGDAAYARAAVGITASGKVFAFCGQQVQGSAGVSMLEMAQIMKDLGCVSAMTFEGSSSPNMHVNKMATVVNSKVDSGAAEKAMQVAVAFK